MNSQQSDYYSNHIRSIKFPWSLYHRPLESSLSHFLEEVASQSEAPKVLVIGCGLLVELPYLPKNLQITCTDVDPRAVENARGLQDSRIREAFVSSQESVDLEAVARFDAIYMKEVIEHIEDPLSYLKKLRPLLKPEGRIWLSTPNYGEPWLPLIEYSVLEIIARRSGFTRKNLHPSKFSQSSFKALLETAGFSKIHCDVVSCRFALVATASF